MTISRFTGTVLIALSLMAGTQRSYSQDEGLAQLEVLFTDFEDRPLAGEQLIFTSRETGKEYKGLTDEEGKFLLEIPKGEVYDIEYMAVNRMVAYDKPLSVPDEEGLFTINYHLKYEMKTERVFELENVYFETDKANLKPVSFEVLDHLVYVMNSRPDMKIEVAGHTDNVGEDEYNRELSQRRAEAVRDYLLKQGIDPSRVSARGYGESDPVDTNDTVEGRQNNRRTEVRILED